MMLTTRRADNDDNPAPDVVVVGIIAFVVAFAISWNINMSRVIRGHVVPMSDISRVTDVQSREY